MTTPVTMEAVPGYRSLMTPRASLPGNGSRRKLPTTSLERPTSTMALSCAPVVSVLDFQKPECVCGCEEETLWRGAESIKQRYDKSCSLGIHGLRNRFRGSERVPCGHAVISLQANLPRGE